MQALIEKNGMSLKDLSAAVGMAHSTVSGIVDRLEKRGMLETPGRHSRPSLYQDRRLQAVRDYMRNEMPSIQLQPIVRALQRANPTECETIIEGLRTLRRLMEQD